MTAKEKAKELVEKYQFNGDMIDDVRMSEDDAIECALICVDEIINTGINQDYIKQDGYMLSLVEFYEEVKEEINKL
tara:strand:- start:129 stop:356 length:228 start_codon:yes stop_codon:yes gene_type:complete